MKEAILIAYEQKGRDMGDGGVHVKAHLVRHVATSLSALKRFSMKDALKAFSLASVFWISVLWTDSMSQLSRLGGFMAA